MNGLKEDEQALEAEAATWVVRLEAGPLDPAEQQAFEAWLGKSDRHAAAFTFARTTWAELKSLQAPSRPAEASPPPAPRQMPPARSRRPVSRRWIWHGLAASVLLAAGLGAFNAVDPLVALRADYRTAPGDTRRVTLPDGSIAQLNTDSAIVLRYGAARREVELLEGEAVFTVARPAGGDPRPFVAHAAGVEARALGTRFALRRQDASVEVTVIEHRVEVSLGETAASPRAGQAVVLQPAQAVRYDAAGGMGKIRRVDPERGLAWLRGWLFFDQVPLAQAMAELNRYRHGRILIVNPALAGRRVSGAFRLDDLSTAVDVIARELDARVVQAPFFTAIY